MTHPARRLLRTQRRNHLRSALSALLVAGCICASPGCSSGTGARVASLNPFSKTAPATTTINGSGTDSSWFDGPKNVGSSIAGSAKGAATKSRETVAGWFGQGNKPDPGVIEGDETDPTSLAHKAEVTPEVFVANGRLWESTGNYAKAMESYAKALEKRPNDPEALASIARLHFRQENHTQAAEFFGKAIKEKPDDAGLYNDLGLTLSKLGNHSAAASTIEQALRLSPGSSRYANNLASIKFQSGDHAGALEVLVKNNKPAVAHFNMAYLHFKHGQNAESTRHLTQALSYESQSAADAATKRAIERSRELLTQIGSGSISPPGTPPGTAIVAAPRAAGTLHQPPHGVQQALESTTPGLSHVGAANPVQPVSTSNTSVNFGNASYRTPAQSNESFSLPPNFQLP